MNWFSEISEGVKKDLLLTKVFKKFDQNDLDSVVVSDKCVL